MFFQYNFWGILWAFVILALCAMPGNELPDLSFWSLLTFDKVSHAFMFAVLSLFLIVGFIKQYTFPYLRYHATVAAPLIGIAYGGGIELAQWLWLSERSGEMMDLIADAAGSITGVICFYIVYGRDGYVK